MNESIKNLLERRRACSERNSGYDPGSGRIFPQRHGTAEHSYGSDTGSGAGCKAFQNERSCYGQHLRSVLRRPNCDHCLFRQQNGHLCGKRKSCDGKSHECRTCSRRGLLLDSPCKRSF